MCCFFCNLSGKLPQLIISDKELLITIFKTFFQAIFKKLPWDRA